MTGSGARPEHQADSDDQPREACGVFGVYAPGQPVAHLSYLGLTALQHRGEESAGMAVGDGEWITVVKDMGLVPNVFDQRTLAPLTGHVAIGHTRYSTTGSSSWRNAQPVFRGDVHLADTGESAQFALGHNGNLVNTAELAERLGMFPGTVTSDSDLVAELIAHDMRALDDDEKPTLERSMARVLPALRGAFSLVVMDEDRLIGARDPNGFRPLSLGRLGDGWVLASETPALDIIGATHERDLEPGEIVVIDASGPHSLFPFANDEHRETLCVFEFVYFARPDSLLYNRSVHAARVRMGEVLADVAPVEADLVMPVPDSANPAAEGYARKSGIPFGTGLIRNRYVGRTFIAPSQELREQRVKIKLNPLRETIEGRRLVVVDDSIVRGTTPRAVVKMLREAGATEIHWRVSSPPYQWPCFYGMDTGTSGELIAANKSVEEIREWLGADTLAYLDLPALLEAAGPGGYCHACLTGEYPVPVPVTLNKSVLEGGPDGTRHAGG